MAVSFVSADAKDQGSNSATCTLSFAVSTGSNRLLLVFASQASAEVAISGATYNGVSMTAHTEGVAISALRRYRLFYLVAPATGANDVVVTYASASSRPIILVAEFTGVDQTTPLDTITNHTNGSVQNWDTGSFSSSASKYPAALHMTGGTTNISGYTAGSELFNELALTGCAVSSGTPGATSQIAVTITQSADHRGTYFNVIPAVDLPLPGLIHSFAIRRAADY